MAQNSQFNRYNLPIPLRRKLHSSGGGGNMLSVEAGKPYIVELVAGEAIKAGDIIGILDKTEIEDGHIMAGYSGYKQAPWRSVLPLGSAEYDYNTIGVALHDAQQGDPFRVQTAFEFNYSGVRLNADETERYKFKIGRKCYVTGENEIAQITTTAGAEEFMKTHSKMCCIGVATSETKIKIECFDSYILEE